MESGFCTQTYSILMLLQARSDDDGCSWYLLLCSIVRVVDNWAQYSTVD
jgi:hypothetical protein